MAQDFFGMIGNMFGGTGGAYDDLLDEAQKKRINQQTLMNVGAKLLQAGGPSRTPTSLGQALGSAMMAGQEARQGAEQNAISQMLTKQKIDEYKRERAKDEQWNTALTGMMSGPVAAANSSVNPIGPSGVPFPSTPTPGNAPVSVQSAMQSNPMSMLSPAQIALISGMGRKEGQSKMFDILSREAPEIIRVMDAMGLPHTMENYERMKRAGATNITSIATTGDKALAGQVGGDVGKQMGAVTEQARAAQSTLTNIGNIRGNVSGAILGPVADARTWLMRASGALGVSGKDDAETLSKTRSVVQAMAREELNAASLMKNQGTLTDAERGILRKAALGDQSITADELNVAMNAVEKIAREKLALHGNLLKHFGTLPGMQQYIPFYTVDGAVNPIDAELARRQQGGK